MSEAGDMLVIGRQRLARELEDVLGPRSLTALSDPYDALMELGRRRWPAVVLEAPQPELPGLARACRRLQPDSRLVAVCPPSGEPEARDLVGEGIDDYVISPPTHDDLPELRGGEPAVTGPRATALTNDMIVCLVEASGSVAGLETAVAEIVGKAVGAEAAWADVGHAPAGSRQLLLADIGSPRVMFTAKPPARMNEPALALLAAVERCLPALAAAARRSESLRRLAITDQLTGLHNRRYFYLATDRVLAREAKLGRRAALLLYDIDDFKHYNETFGYAVGDEVLRQTAAMMKSISRTHDIVARIGGEEFAVLFWDPQGPRTAASQPLRTAYDLSDRFRRAVASRRFSMLGPQAVGTLTISGGLAQFPRDGHTVRDLLRSADQALKSAKRSGKNGIRIIGA